MGAIIEAIGLAKYYKEVKALDGLDLSVPEGTILGLLGPNGAGKTTAVNILTTLIRPDCGLGNRRRRRRHQESWEGAQTHWALRSVRCSR